MILPASYLNGFAPRDGQPLYPSLWTGCLLSYNHILGITGTQIFDYSGRKRNGTGSAITWSPGGIISFQNAKITIANLSLHTQSELSITTRIRRTASNNYTYLFSDEDASVNTAISLQLYNTHNLTLFRAKAGAYSADTLSGALTLNKFYTITGTISDSNGQQSIWVDGQLVSQNTITGATKPVTSGASQIGAYRTGSLYFIGDQKEFYLHNRVLSPQEIKLLASREGIAYEMAPRRRSSVQSVVSYSTFRPSVLRGSK